MLISIYTWVSLRLLLPLLLNPPNHRLRVRTHRDKFNCPLVFFSGDADLQAVVGEQL